MNTRLLLFVATIAISVIGSTVALADETGYVSPSICAQASGELTGNAAVAADRAKVTAVAHIAS